MKRLKLAILFGGQSPEHPVSIMSARSVINAVDPDKYEIFPLAITREGNWLSPYSSRRVLEGETLYCNSGEAFLARKGGRPHLCYMEDGYCEKPLDVAFPVLHGPFGEDGTVQGLLEMVGLPYVGAGVAPSVLAMDKGLMKEKLGQKGLPQTEFRILKRESWRVDMEICLERAISAIGFPAFVKPAALGSSLGIFKVKSREELQKAAEEGFELGSKVLVEKMVSGRELECSVLGNEKLEVAGPGEVVSLRDFYDYEAKYTEGQARLIMRPELPEEDRELCRELSLAAVQALEIRGMARVDFFYPAPGRILINEINTIPGFTPFSMFPQLWIEEGLEYSHLIDRLIGLALGK